MHSLELQKPYTFLAKAAKLIIGLSTTQRYLHYY
jgi:hypothetical protein